MESDNPWDWVAEVPPPLDVSAEHVTAVLVTRQAGRWLGEALASLSRLDAAPARLLAIDNDSTDASVDLLADAVDAGIVDAAFAGSATFGFGTAVQAALDADSVEEADRGPKEAASLSPEHRWLWLLHDDVTVSPDSLRRLLELAVTEPDARLIGPKLLQPARGGQPERLLELGRSISNSGRRVLSIEPGEVDQGQHDEPTEVLGLSSCGLLIRSDVWAELGGLDEALPLFRDGEDLGWRASLRGHRVLTCPAATIHHRQVGLAGVRDGSLADPDPQSFDRLMAMRTVAAQHTGLAAVGIWVRLVLGGIARAAGLALGKAGRASIGELRAVRGFVGSGAELRRMRRDRARHPATEAGRNRTKGLRPTWWAGPQRFFETVAGGIGDTARAWRGDEAPETSIDELTAEGEFSPGEDDERRWWHSPTLVGLVFSVIGAIAASRKLLASGGLSAQLLLPSPATLGSAFAAYLDPIAGLPGSWSAPWVGLTALGSTLAFGQPNWWVTFIVAGSVPLAYLSAVFTSRRLLRPGWAGVSLCLLYALVPVLLGAFARGDLQVLGLAILLPLLVWAVAQFWNGDHPWRAGFQVALVGVFVTSLLPAASALIGLAMLAGAALRRDRWLPGLLGFAGSWLVQFVWIPTLFTHPGRLLTGPDPTLVPSAVASTLELVIGRTSGVGLPPLLLSVGLFALCWVAGLGVLAWRPSDPLVLAALSSVVVALVAAVVSSHLVVGVSPAGDLARPSATGWLLIMASALLLTLGRGVGLLDNSRRRNRPGIVVATVLLVAALGSSAFWVSGASTSSDPTADARLHRVAEDQLPPFVVKAQVGPNRLRALVVDLSAEPRWSLVQDGGTSLGAGERGFALGGSAVAQRQLGEGVARIASASSDAALAADLAGLGVGYLKVDGATDRQITGLENTPGLGVGIADRGATVWTVSPTRARRVLLDGADRQPVLADIAESGEPRTLLLGEPQDENWRATLNGQALEPVEAGWQQGFAVPAGGGDLDVSYSAPGRGLLAGAQLLLLVVLIVGATPGIRRDEAERDVVRARRGRSPR